MKWLVLSSLLLGSVGAFASSGQQFREDSRNFAKAHKLQVQREIYPAIALCEGDSEEEALMLMTDSTGVLYYISMSGFAGNGDNGADRATLVRASDCSKRVLRF